MSQNSAIEWTEATWNPTTGCTKVSPGCANCYIERTPPFRINGRRFVKGHIPLALHEDRLDQPLRWRKPRRVFVNSLSDLFHEDVPDAFIDRVFAVMALASWHTFQILTKRAERMRDYCAALTFERVRVWMNRAVDGDELTMPTPAGGFTPNWKENLTTIARRTKEYVYRFDPLAMPMRTPPPPFLNVWLGPSIENQHFADVRFPIACELAEAGWNVMVSMEPLLGPVVIPERFLRLGRRGWVIVGGESGPKTRPTNPEWVRSIRDQCVTAGVWFFFKQWGGLTAKAGGRVLDGREWSEYPDRRSA